MSWEYIEYEYQVTNTFHKHLLWLSTDCNLYFAFKEKTGDDWTYFAGEASHSLSTGKVLTNYGSAQSSAETNYVTTSIDSNGKFLAVLPSTLQAKYARVYVETGSGVTIYEWRPSTYFSAHEIISGEIEISDQLSDAPKLTVTSDSITRVKVGKVDDAYGIVGYDDTSATIFELTDENKTIGGWEFNATQFTKNNAILSSEGKIKVGSGTDVAILDAQDSNYRIIVGDSTYEDAKFKVTKAGKLDA
jgi:hypothetical protein